MGVPSGAMEQWVTGDRPGRRTTLAPGETIWPFDFPIIVVGPDLTITGHRTPRTFGVCDEDAARRGECPEFEVFAGCGRAWKPLRIMATSEPRARLFGRALVNAVFELTAPRSYDFEDLRDMIARSILDDPEERWTQLVSDGAMLGAVEAVGTFADLVDVIIELGGQGE